MAKVISNKNLEVHILPALADNYIYVLHESGTKTCAVVDPGESKAVEDFLAKTGWTLNTVFCTHHHHDHIDGISDLFKNHQCEVITSPYDSSRIPHASKSLAEGETTSIGNHSLKSILVPGHTLGHMALYIESTHWLFSGDTLFAMGCGRLFEGTATQLHHSLSRLTSLPPQTEIFCGHEYTFKNSQFALSIEPGNQILVRRHKELTEQLSADSITLPSRIDIELETNPFLRPFSPEIRRRLGMEKASDVEVFTRLRELRNHWNAPITP